MIETLRNAWMMSELTPAQLSRVGRHSARVVLDEGQQLFSQGDPAERFYLVVRGQIRLFRLSPEGDEKVIEIVAPGQTFAEALMFLNAPLYPVCAAALCPAELIGVEARDFADMLRDSVETCFLLLGSLSKRLRGLIGEIDNLTLHTATSRVARYLLMNASDDGLALELDVRKCVVASRLSVKPETFSRVIRRLSDEGVIEVRGNFFTIVNRARLEQVAELRGNRELGLLPGKTLT
jgi:CRP-like cAMP-binding protein